LAQPISNTETGSGEQDRDGGTQIRADEDVREAVDGDTPALVRVRMSVSEAPADDVHLGPCLLECHAWLELGARAEPAKITPQV
jgi:hypothetical protein